MKFYPINLNLKDKRVLIVGAGRVALRKFERLLQIGKQIKQIKVVSPEFNQGFIPYLRQEPASNRFKFIQREFKKKDLMGQFLVFAATDKAKFNQQIALLAKEKNILVNIIDNAQISDFTVPAAVNRGELLLTVSSGSNLPALSKKVKEKLEQEFGLEYQILLEVMKEKRAQIIAEIDEISVRRSIFRKLASDQFLNKIQIIIDQLNFDLENNNLKQIFSKVEAEIDKIIAELRDD